MRREGTKSRGCEGEGGSAALPAITPEMKCCFSFLLIPSKCERPSTKHQRPEVQPASHKTLFFLIRGKKNPKTHLRELAQPSAMLVRWILSCFLFSQLCFGCAAVTPLVAPSRRRCFFRRSLAGETCANLTAV